MATEYSGVFKQVDENGNVFILRPETIIETDSTLSVSGEPADAKAVGDKFTEVNNTIKNIDTTVTKSEVTSALGYTPPSYLAFTNTSVAASAWATYTASLDQEADIITAGYTYKADITLTGVTADHAVEVSFGAAEIEDGVFAPYVNSRAGKIRIYANAKPTAAITIPTITAIKKM